MFSFHTHSTFCDGKSTIDEMCEEAVKQQFISVAFTSHAPVPFKNSYSLKFDQIDDYKQAIIKVSEDYKGKLGIYIGLEADFVPSQTISFDNWRKLMNPHFLIGSVHLVLNRQNGKKWFIDGDPSNFHKGLEDVYNGDIRTAVHDYFQQVREMIIVERPDVIGHFDKVKMNNQGIHFSTDEPFYQDELTETLKVISEYGGIVEINARGIYKNRCSETFPSIDVIKRCCELNIPLTLASDAHHADDLKPGFDIALKAAIDSGVKKIMIFEDHQWIERPISDFINK
jgi:histidinol-phosphatase (PHP family)